VFNGSQEMIWLDVERRDEVAITLPFLFRGQQTRSWRRKIGCSLLLYSIGPCGLFVWSQSSNALEAKVSFSAQLDGGSKGVPSHLPGTIYVSTDRVEFQAFPQVESIIWSCEQIEHLSFGKETATLETRRAKYRFSLKSAQQATAFIEETHSACRNRDVPIGTPTAR
jgi:hypothetical protein